MTTKLFARHQEPAEDGYSYRDDAPRKPGPAPAYPRGFGEPASTRITVYRDRVHIADTWIFSSGPAYEYVEGASEVLSRADPHLLKRVAEKLGPEVVAELEQLLADPRAFDRPHAAPAAAPRAPEPAPPALPQRTLLVKRVYQGEEQYWYADWNPPAPEPCQKTPAGYGDGSPVRGIGVYRDRVEIQDSWCFSRSHTEFFVDGTTHRLRRSDPQLTKLLAAKLRPELFAEVERVLADPKAFTPLPLKLLERGEHEGRPVSRYTDHSPRNPDPPPEYPAGFAHGSPFRVIVVSRADVLIQDVWCFASGHAELYVECEAKRFRRDAPELLRVVAEKFEPAVVAEVEQVLAE